MHEVVRQQYLRAMGIMLWYPRMPLPFAAASSAYSNLQQVRTAPSVQPPVIAERAITPVASPEQHAADELARDQALSHAVFADSTAPYSWQFYFMVHGDDFYCFTSCDSSIEDERIACLERTLARNILSALHISQSMKLTLMCWPPVLHPHRQSQVIHDKLRAQGWRVLQIFLADVGSKIKRMLCFGPVYSAWFEPLVGVDWHSAQLKILELPSLQQMLASGDAKRQAWQCLSARSSSEQAYDDSDSNKTDSSR